MSRLHHERGVVRMVLAGFSVAVLDSVVAVGFCGGLLVPSSLLVRGVDDESVLTRKWTQF